MIAKLRTLWASDTTTVVIAALTIGMGLKSLHNVYDKRTDELTTVTEQLAARRAQLADAAVKHEAFMAEVEQARERWRRDLDAHRPAYLRSDQAEETGQ